MKKIALVVLVLAVCFSTVVNVLAGESMWNIEARSSSRFFMVGEKNVTIGEVEIWEVGGDTSYSCGDKINLSSLPLKVVGQTDLLNIKFTQYDKNHSDKHELVATANITKEGDIVDIKQIKPWQGRVLYVDADVSPNAVTTNYQQFQSLRIGDVSVIKSIDGKQHSIMIADNDSRNAIVRYRATIAKTVDGARNFSYRIVSDQANILRTYITAMTWPKTNKETFNANIEQLKCSLNGEELKAIEFHEMGSWSFSWPYVKNGDIIQCRIDDKADINQYVLNIGVGSPSHIFGVPTTTHGEMIFMDYQDRVNF
jgi:hypothetical protein